MKAHCEKIAALSEKQARELDALATMHREQAK
jgi:hypothetical protein